VYLPPGTIVKFSTGMRSKNRKEWYDFLRFFLGKSLLLFHMKEQRLNVLLYFCRVTTKK
jgi:hypothetical protein